MFGPSKITHFLDKTFTIGCLGLVIAICGSFMLKNGLEKLILGGGSHYRYARVKGLVLIPAAIAMLAIGMSIILEPEAVMDLFTLHARDSLMQQLNLA